MRLGALLSIGSAMAFSGLAQTVAPVPADAHELVTGTGGAMAGAADPGQALALLFSSVLR